MNPGLSRNTLPRCSRWVQARWAAQCALAGAVCAGATLGWWVPRSAHDALHLAGASVGLLWFAVVGRRWLMAGPDLRASPPERL